MVTKNKYELLEQLFVHDKETGRHSVRVADLAVKIGKVLGLSGHELIMLKTAALLHGIGKLFLPASLLQKSGKLTDEEYTMIKCHTDNGYLYLSQLGFPEEICLVALDHHERPDGNGYRKKKDFSLFAKIVCVADCLDVMRSGRCYQTPKTVEQIQLELLRCSGTQFDPAAAKAAMEFLIPGYALTA